MKKTNYILFTLILATGFSASAQFSAGLESGFPMGNFSDIASTGFGASVRYEKTIKNQLRWTASAGYLSFSGKTFTSGNVSIPFDNTTNIPFAGGIKYYFSEPGKGFYGGLDLSLNLLSTYVYTINSGNGGGYTLISQSENKFGINPGIGYRLPHWDFAARYNAVGDFSYFGIRAAYVFASK